MEGAMLLPFFIIIEKRRVNPVKIEAIPALEDNYIWIIQEGDEAVVIDPGESQSVIDFLEERKLKLIMVLLTHNHEDHTGGVEGLEKFTPNLPVYGPRETAEYAGHILGEGDQILIFGHAAQIYLTPGHTQGHISYLIADQLFCGDALFSAGCGRVFTGDYEAQYKTLRWFANLDEEIKVYAGHEYTQKNLRFAKLIEPGNQAVEEALETTEKILKQGKPTLPSTIEREKKINILMQAETLEEFIRLRELRNEF